MTLTVPGPTLHVPDDPLLVPLSKVVGWTEVHAWTQSPARDETRARQLLQVRRTATIRRGTRMTQVLSGGQVSAYLTGRLLHGFCYREYDVAYLRTPEELLGLCGAAGTRPRDVAYVLRWRAVDPADYQTPYAGRLATLAGGPDFSGLVSMPSHDRAGAPILGTGFSPSTNHVVPEFVTANLADLPMPANATLVAAAPDGTEVPLYTYQPEQRGWIRLVGPQWRHLLAGVPDIAPTAEFLALPKAAAERVRLVGWYRGTEYDAVADPPREFRVLAMTRAARYPVERLSRRTWHVRWRDAECTVVHQDGAWLRLRLIRPDAESVATLGAQCYERGMYEAWAPAGDVLDAQAVETAYALDD